MACFLARLLVVVVGVFVSVEGGPRYNGMLRIVPSRSYPYRGRLEVMWHYRWGTICNDHFTHRSAHVACKQLNLPGGWRVGHYNHNICRRMDGRDMCGRRWIWMDNVWCRGWERRLMDCHRWPMGWHNCHHSEDVMVHCRSPPLWNIQWGFDDEPDSFPYTSGVVSRYVVRFKETATPNIFIKCWPMWKLNKNLKVKVYTDDTFEADKKDHLPIDKFHWSWLYGFLRKPWYTPYVYFDMRGHHCDLEKIRAVSCKGFEVPIDVEKSYCREWTARMPQEFALLQQDAAVIPISNQTNPPQHRRPRMDNSVDIVAETRHALGAVARSAMAWQSFLETSQ